MVPRAALSVHFLMFFFRCDRGDVTGFQRRVTAALCVPCSGTLVGQTRQSRSSHRPECEISPRIRNSYGLEMLECLPGITAADRGKGNSD